MSGTGRSRRFDAPPVTSDLPQTTDAARPTRLVRFVPINRRGGDTCRTKKDCPKVSFSTELRVYLLPSRSRNCSPLARIELAGCSFGSVLWARVECDFRARCCLMDGVDHHLE